MTATVISTPTVTSSSRHVPVRRPRNSVWPYAGLVSGAAAGGAAFLISMGQDTFTHKGVPSADFIVSHLNSETSIRFGAGLGFVSVAAALVFLIGLTRFAEKYAAARTTLLTAMRWSSVALIGSAGIGTAMHYVAASGHPGSVDQNQYTKQASATMAVLADQLDTAAFLPALFVMVAFGVIVLRDRVLARPVGAVAIVMAAGSAAATLVLGLPYSSGLVYPLFAVVVGAAAVASRKAA